jgi:hypothetical protein
MRLKVRRPGAWLLSTKGEEERNYEWAWLSRSYLGTLYPEVRYT